MGRPEKALVDAETPAGAFGSALRDARHAAGMNQTELADRSGCSPATVSQVERARFLPAYDLVLAWEVNLAALGQLIPLWSEAVLRAHRRRRCSIPYEG
ncbi:helix-turn-helix transcriptional regulator [Plantibacter sp. CFBP 8804]|uniref:helix-turn-helix transcriptional regulator n=1 Tax=Plantibacter sp. CFBP 8804 TaxID=2775270 RepID=UPI00177D8A57|nr:helix-turn-helix transcriptional regulator [Plantibacter sp. CFBP 8804]